VTSSRRVVRRGRQDPRVLLRPRFDSEEDAHDAIDLIATCGQELDPFQVLLVCITLASIDGNLAASEVGGLIARQNGKGGWLEAIAIWSLFEPYLYGDLEGRKNTTLWTAHELKTSDEAYARVKSLIEANPDLAAEVVVWNGGLSGTHIIQLRDGSRLVFLARSKSSGRGFSPRRIIFDEAQEFSTLAFRAMMYATSAQGARRQLIYAGTVPSEENDAAIWTGVRDRGRAGVVAKLAWAEWTPEGSDDPTLTIDPTDWKAREWSNPALGARILASTIDEEWEAAQADLEGFLRERLSVWPSLGHGKNADGAFPGWIAAGDEKRVPPEGPAAIGLSVSLDREWASIASAGFTDDGETFLGAVRREPGTRWLIDEAARIQDEHGCAVAINGAGPGKNLIPDLENAGVDLTILSDADACDAYADLRDGVGKAHTHVHAKHPELDAAVRVTTERKLAQRLALGQLAGEDGSMAEAAMIAAWLANHSESSAASVFGGNLELCDRCGDNPHEDPDGVHNYLCPDCREDA
jgi:hypothetical protein